MVASGWPGTGEILSFKDIDIDINAHSLSKIQGEIGKKTSGRPSSYYGNGRVVVQFKAAGDIIFHITGLKPKK
jgi:hypothetical protein